MAEGFQITVRGRFDESGTDAAPDWTREAVAVYRPRKPARPYPRTYYPRCRVDLTILLRDVPGRDDRVHVVSVVPRSVQVERNTYREADTVRLELDYRDFPLDPRSVASIRVAVHLAEVASPEDVLPLDGSALRFVGFVDEPEATLGVSGETVRLEGRDYTSLFLDHRWAGGALDATRTVDETIRAVLEAVPGAADIPIELGDLAGKRISDVTGKTKWTPEDSDDAWSVIDQIAGLWGFVPTMVIDTLVFRTPGQVRQRRAHLTYGRNVTSLRYTRKLTERKLVQVELRAFDPAAGTTKTVLYPADPLVVARKVGADGKATAEHAPRMPFYVEGSYSDAELEAIAKAVFDEGAQADTEGAVTTKEMADLFGDDLVGLANGDEIVVRLGKQDATALSGLSDEQAVNYLRATGGLDEFAARAVVAAWRRSEDELIRFYVVRAVHSWSRDDGYELDVQFANYAGGRAP